MIKKHLQNPYQFEEIDQGWKNLILEFLDKYDKLVQVPETINTVKEKFGGLRIYTDCHTDIINDLIAEYEEKSLKTCGDCGSEVDCERHSQSGWFRTMCRACALKRDPTGKSQMMPRLMFKTPFGKLS